MTSEINIVEQVERMHYAVEPAMANRECNVASTERMASLLLGSGMLGAGLARRSWKSVALVGLGIGLVARGLTGRCAVYRWLGIHESEKEAPDTLQVLKGVKYETAIHILRPPDEVYRFFQNAEQLSTVAKHLHLVASLEGGRTRWIAQGPLGTHIRWDAELVCQRENELLAFRSLPGSDIDMGGAVGVEAGPDGHGTVLTLTLKLALPDSSASAAILDLLGVGLEQILDEDLQRVKEFLEAGDAAGGIDPSYQLSHG